MNLILAIPLEVRLVGLFLLGTLLGAMANLAAYRLAWNKRSISPWSSPPEEAAWRAWYDRLPVVGWLALRREARLHGRGFWLRPLLVELATGAGLATLYWWEVARVGLAPPLPAQAMPPYAMLHMQFLSHSILLLLMLAASLIDLDEKLIPDEVTITGTLLGLALAALYPWALPSRWMPIAPVPPTAMAVQAIGGGPLVNSQGEQLCAEFLAFYWPGQWPAALPGAPHLKSLALGLGCYLLWCFAILERPWYGRHGWRRGLAVATAHMCRQLRAGWQAMALLAALGGAGILGVWAWGGANWIGLLTALVGMAGGGGLVWAVRLVGQFSLKKEAMGFGDVMLLMMVGTFVGWQAAWLTFFLAPFAALVVGILQIIIRRDQYIPYGPFLCLATLAVLVTWRWTWFRWAQELFRTGWNLLAVVGVGLVLIGVLLWIMRMVRERLFAV